MIKACKNCIHYDFDKYSIHSNAHGCMAFASVLTGENKRITCLEARQTILPTGCLNPDSKNSEKGCGRDGEYFFPNEKTRMEQHD